MDVAKLILLGPSPTADARGPAPNGFWGPAPRRLHGALPPTASGALPPTASWGGGGGLGGVAYKDPPPPPCPGGGPHVPLSSQRRDGPQQTNGCGWNLPQDCHLFDKSSRNRLSQRHRTVAPWVRASAETRTEQEKRLEKLLRSCRAALDVFRSVKECTAHGCVPLCPATDLNSSMEEFVCPTTISHHSAC